MYVELDAPACLPLGLAMTTVEGRPKPCLVGVALQHPPVNLAAQPGRKLDLTGPRSDVGYQYARQFLNHHNLEPKAQVEIELAIPAFVGLGSETLLGLSLARSLAWTFDLPFEKPDSLELARALRLDPHEALEFWAFRDGGLLVVEAGNQDGQMPAVVERLEIAHEKEKDAWAFVFFFPRIPEEVDEKLESIRRLALLEAAPHLGQESEEMPGLLKQAVASDDLDAFGRILMNLHRSSHQALAAAGAKPALSDEDRAVLRLIQEFGAAAWGQSLGGLGLYGLVRGGQASRELRQAIRRQVGYAGGIVMATITDNDGARHVIREGNLNDKSMGPIRTRQ